MWPSDARGESNSIWSNLQNHSNRPPTCRRDSTKSIAFEASVVTELRELAGSDWVFVDETASPGLQVEATTSAIAAAEVAVVVGARLGDDAAAARSGAPDVLVYTRGGYVAVDVKHHRTINAGDAVLLTSTLAVPTPTAAAPLADSQLRADKDDALQLAHYRRMLQTQGAGRTDLSGGHHRQGTACGLVRPRRGDVDHPRQVRRQETQAHSFGGHDGRSSSYTVSVGSARSGHAQCSEPCNFVSQKVGRSAPPPSTATPDRDRTAATGAT